MLLDHPLPGGPAQPVAPLRVLQERDHSLGDARAFLEQRRDETFDVALGVGSYAIGPGSGLTRIPVVSSTSFHVRPTSVATGTAPHAIASSKLWEG